MDGHGLVHGAVRRGQLEFDRRLERRRFYKMVLPRVQRKGSVMGLRGNAEGPRPKGIILMANVASYGRSNHSNEVRNVVGMPGKLKRGK